MSRPRTYWDVAEIIEARIHEGIYPPGSQLPTQEQLADEFRIARGTVSKAIAILKDRGVILSRPPVGVFVAE
jgi:DNA-binding GntR family transcriptional regulator